MTKTAKRLRKNNTKKMKGGGWFMDTFNKITGRQRQQPDPELHNPALIVEKQKMQPEKPPGFAEITKKNHQP